MRSASAKPANASQFDVDDVAGVEPDGLFSVVRGANGFVQADGRGQLRLQLRVIDDVVMRERLLNHHEIEIVEAAQVICIGERVSGVRVGHERRAREALADFIDHPDVPAWLDLDFDALISGGEFRLDLLQQGVDGILNADRDAAGDFTARSTANVLP